MPPSKPTPGAPPGTGYSQALKSAAQETTLRVKEMHDAIAGKSFALLRRIPLVGRPARWVQGAHDMIGAGVYAAIHHGVGGLCAAADVIERSMTDASPRTPPGQLASGLRSALNGAFGDRLAASGNRLAIDMALYVNATPIALDGTALRNAFPDAGRRLCLFIHGLGCDEHCWRANPAEDGQVDFGQELRAGLGYTPLYLRYNTGLPIAENGRQLAALLDELLAHWPEKPVELSIVGHSMGGLLARSACEQAIAAQLDWPEATRMLIFLGSPHLGSPVERLGHLVASALNLSTVSAPLGKIAAARSQGIRDLRQGTGVARPPPRPARVAYRFLGASLTDDVDHPLGNFPGDGLVTLKSATAHDGEGDVRSARLGGIGHMGLLTERRVYRQIADWLDALA